MNRGIKGDCSNAFHFWEGIFWAEKISLLIVRIEVICKRKRQSKLEQVSFENAHKYVDLLELNVIEQQNTRSLRYAMMLKEYKHSSSNI